MLNAAMVLGIIGGVVGMLVGFFGYGFAELWTMLFGAIEQMEAQTGFQADLQQPPEDPMVTRLISLFAPILGIAGGAMAPGRPGPGAALLIASAAGMFWGFGFGVFTMFPIAMCGLAGLMALPAALSRPPEGGA
ncbi:hypothetical protein LNKW23_30960 [Paralimibaculum aggregatum]|uniref:Uncharacterized protein n=1 Tax=Paralimibaculum aggregatum TaxID=3036245 RepID=A0ABQ6LKW7_9RHOB|nr:hypothetical protein [Limibaculum sp. NKW23]GMG83882.1 hypothetical protein LNKW23_30960 [Limibaculum sp. NKW23]